VSTRSRVFRLGSSPCRLAPGEALEPQLPLIRLGNIEGEGVGVLVSREVVVVSGVDDRLEDAGHRVDGLLDKGAEQGAVNRGVERSPPERPGLVSGGILQLPDL